MSKLYGLLGEKLSHSLSPEIHNAIFDAINIEGCYHLFEVERASLKTAVFGLGALGAIGVNVTIPYKIDVMNYMDKISPEALSIGSINTISFYDGKLTGYNTDYYGFGSMLERHGVDVKNKKAIILGNGGVTKTAYRYLVDNKAGDIGVVSRRKGQSNGDAVMMSYDDLEHITNWDILINCTPCGMYPNMQTSPVEKHIIGRFGTVLDLIYNPRETLFLKYARQIGLKAVNGLSMLVGQAVKANEIWNGIQIDKETVEIIYSQIENCNRLY